MGDAAEGTVPERAQELAARGEWRHAYELLDAENAREPLTGAALALFAGLAYAAGHVGVTIAAWERAHADAVRLRDSVAGAEAAVRVAMHLMFDTALMAPVRGWLARAERLLDGVPETSVHAWLAVIRNYERLLSGDFEAAGRWARQAVELGDRFDPAAAAIGRLAEARNLILAGDVQQGLALLEEAAVATVSGELDPVSTGMVYCELVCALQGLAQYDLAEEWTALMEQWHHGQPVGSIHGRCRVHRAEILRLRGDYPEAEREALLACEELRPYLRREFGWPLTELGHIRLRRGDLPGAREAFLAAHTLGWDPEPGLALLYLAEGNVVLAARSIAEAIEHPANIPSKERPPHSLLRRAPLLEAEVEIAIAAGDLERARAAADDLTDLAATFQSKALVAGAALARGRVAQAGGDPAGARGEFERTVSLWHEVGAPYEAAVARMGLALAYRSEGNAEHALLEFGAAQAGFEQIGALARAAEAARASRDSTPDPQGPPPSSARVPQRGAHGNENVFRREGDYWFIAFEGRTVRVRDMKGIRYLARLLAEPGREFHVLELVAAENHALSALRRGVEPELAFPASSDAGELLDAEARESYRRRLAEIEEDLEQAHQFGDSERTEQARTERDFVLRELSRAFGLGGRPRRAASNSERARASVTRAVRHAMSRIGAHDHPLGEHLDHAIQTGTYCAYRPDPRLPMHWTP